MDVEQIPPHLLHPLAARIPCHAHDLDHPAPDADHYQHVIPNQTQRRRATRSADLAALESMLGSVQDGDIEMSHVIGRFVRSKLGLKTAQELTARLALENECLTAIDIGCGNESHLTALRPQLKTLGLDSSQADIEASRASNAHDYYVCADILKSDDIASLLPPEFGGKADIVALYGVIEHLPKALGLEMLAKCTALSRKLVLLETPNGFQPQGPEFGNEHMRHLSGWFIHDFEGHGFTVVGTTGTRYLIGYGGGLKYPYRGVGSLDAVLSRALRIDKNPKRAFNLFAYKDVRGVPARMG